MTTYHPVVRRRRRWWWLRYWRPVAWAVGTGGVTGIWWTLSPDRGWARLLEVAAVCGLLLAAGLIEPWRR